MKNMHGRVTICLIGVALVVAACAGGKGGNFNLQSIDIGQLAQNLKGLREVSEPEEIEIGVQAIAKAIRQLPG